MAALVAGSKGPYPYHEGRHLIVATREWIFTDESGTHGPAKWCLVAGFRASPGQWAKFDTAWRKALREHRATEPFHSREFFNRENWTWRDPNQFVGWKPKRAASLLSALQGVITRQRIYLVGGAVDVPAFEALADGDRAMLVGYVPPDRLPAGYNQIRIKRPEPYMLGYHLTLSIALHAISPTTEMHMKIARHQQYGPRAVQNFWAMKDASSVTDPAVAAQMKDITPVDPVDSPGVQAADLLCFLWYRVLTAGPRNLSTEEYQTFNVIMSRPGVLQTASAEQMQGMLDMHGAEARELFSVLKF